MNVKIAALGGFALLTVGLLLWLVLADAPSVPGEDGQDDDETAASEDESGGRQRHRVTRERTKAEIPVAEIDEQMDLPGALPKLKVQPQPPAAVQEQPAATSLAAQAPRPLTAEEQEQNAAVMRQAIAVANRCWQQTRKTFPHAGGELMARLHLGQGPNGRVVVRNLELDELGVVHPELLGCLDRDLMRLDLDLPNGVARIVNAPLRLLAPGAEGVAGMGAPAGTVTPPPDYADPAIAHASEPPPGEAVPPPGEYHMGVVADPHMPPGEPHMPPGEPHMPPDEPHIPPAGLHMPPGEPPEEHHVPPAPTGHDAPAAPGDPPR